MMRGRSLTYAALLALVTLTLAGLLARADDKKGGKDKPALSGSWVMKGGEVKIVFADKDTLKIAPHGSDEVFLVLCSYTVEKGRVQAKITAFEGKDEAKQKAQQHLPVGSEFSFQWKVDGETGTLEGVKGEQADLLKSHLEGKYEKKK